MKCTLYTFFYTLGGSFYLARGTPLRVYVVHLCFNSVRKYVTRCQLATPYGLAPKFTHRLGVHIGRQSLMTLAMPKQFYCSKIVAPAMAGVAGALPPAMYMAVCYRIYS